MLHVFSNASAQPTDPPVAYWTRHEQELFLRRIGHADATAIGIVRAVSSFGRKGDPVKVTLAFLPERVIHGSLEEGLDAQGELLLSLEDEDLDFRRAFKVQRFLPGKRFLVFFKRRPIKKSRRPRGEGWRASLWRPPPEPKPVYRWTLYGPEALLVSRVQALYRMLKKR